MGLSQRPFSDLSTGRQSYIEQLIRRKPTKHEGVLVGSTDIECNIIVDVDGVKEDDAIWNEWRIPLDKYSRAIQGIHCYILRFICGG